MKTNRAFLIAGIVGFLLSIGWKAISRVPRDIHVGDRVIYEEWTRVKESEVYGISPDRKLIQLKTGWGGQEWFRYQSGFPFFDGISLTKLPEKKP